MVFFAGEAQNARWAGMVPAAHLSAKEAAHDVVTSLREPAVAAGLSQAQGKLTLTDTLSVRPA